jgi:SAM-dependent methyltransferase
MKGTFLQKAGRLIANLAFHPHYLPRYLAHNVFIRKSPLVLEVPGISYAAIDFLESWLQPHMRVCEFGTGGSTLFFAKRVQSVLSIEEDWPWFELVSRRLKEESLGNVQIELCPFDFKDPKGFAKSAYLHAIPDEKFDVIVVDGSEEWVHIRPLCFYQAESKIKPDGIILVDDSWRYPALRENHGAKFFRIFQSVGPGRPGVTSTDVFFY